MSPGCCTPDSDADSAQPGDFLSLQFVRPFVLDDGSSKSLHFIQGELQSRMLTHHPWRLEVDYTRTMMGFLLFQPAPARIGMIGLGGGSIAKFCYRYLPASSMTVLEINPHVIALRHAFQVPDDDARFQVIAADGALYLHTQAPQYEVLLVDGFDRDGQSAALCTQRFYDDCHAALPIGGVLVVNLHYDHPDYPLLFERISRSFSANAVQIISAEKSNSIVFARKGRLISPRSLSLTSSLAALADAARAELKPELVHMLWQMKDLELDDGG
ncbi:MAG: transferase [Polaromonas sp.]